MNLNGNTGVDERENWRKRIMRALQELRSADESASSGLIRARHDSNGEEAAADSTDR